MMLKRLSCITRIKFLKYFHVRPTGQKGFGLVEVLVSVAIFGTAAFMLVNSLSSGMLFVRLYKDRVIAENVARTQMALVRSHVQDFIPGTASYPLQADTGDYNVFITVTEIDPFLTDQIQKITVKVYRNDKLLYTLEGVKTKS